ncbi:MAG TPA: hypothetical protein VFM68_03965 [Candidatus Saccharimonadales bacterium]|nr:hypothetical protein [Candidatus Saccharimonadales bacterium]
MISNTVRIVADEIYQSATKKAKLASIGHTIVVTFDDPHFDTNHSQIIRSLQYYPPPGLVYVSSSQNTFTFKKIR